jgi:hypothetical protein
MFTPSPYQKVHGLLHQVCHLRAEVRTGQREADYRTHAD